MSAIVPVGAPTPDALAQVRVGAASLANHASPPADFSQILNAGIQEIDKKLATADNLVQRFTLGETVPVHQVTYALEQARLSVELALQVRGRLLEGFRELMNMQL